MMSRLKELQSNPSNCINIVDTIAFFFPDLKSKYIEMLVRLMKRDAVPIESIRSIYFEFFGDKVISTESINQKKIDSLTFNIQIQIMQKLSNEIDIKHILEFVDFNERGLIEKNDLTAYESFDEMVCQVSAAGIKDTIKKMESQTVKIHDDDDWILVRPLTPISSRKYGSGTKWCTTSLDNNYFINYSNNGILIYCIHKKSGKKVAVYKPLNSVAEGISFWNERDSHIDSIESGLPSEIIRIVLHEINSNPRTNISYLTDLEREKLFNSDTSQKKESGREVRNIVVGYPLDDRPEIEMDDGNAEIGQMQSGMAGGNIYQG